MISAEEHRTRTGSWLPLPQRKFRGSLEARRMYMGMCLLTLLTYLVPLTILATDSLVNSELKWNSMLKNNESSRIGMETGTNTNQLPPKIGTVRRISNYQGMKDGIPLNVGELIMSPQKRNQELLMSGVESNPGPRSKSVHCKNERKGSLKECNETLRSVLYLNARNLNNLKMNDLRKIVRNKRPTCIVINETGGLTGLGKDLNFNIPGYNVFPNDRKISKKGGGTVIWVKKSISSTDANMDPEIGKNIGSATMEDLDGERQWRCLRMGGKDVAICIFYGGVQDGETKLRNNDNLRRMTNEEWNTSLYTLLSREIDALKTMGYAILVVGDTNGHLGKQNNPKCIHEMNSNGEMYKNFAEQNDLQILNMAKKSTPRGNNDNDGSIEGRNLCSGRWTYMEGCRKSIIDYAACSQEFMSWKPFMKIHDKGEFPFVSDHTPILVSWKDQAVHEGNGNIGEKEPTSHWTTTNTTKN